ncbi:MAG: histidine kinase [Bacteroidota bacterium]
MLNTSDMTESVAIPKPRMTTRAVVLSACGWILYALFYSFMVTASGQQTEFVGVFIGQMFAAGIMGVLTIPPWLLVVREMDAFRWPAKIAAHIVIAPVFAWLSLTLFLWLIGYTTGPDVQVSIRSAYSFVFGSNLTAYMVAFALYHALRILQRLRLKEKQAAELQALAKESELAALKAQINPHFLFNTLNSMNAMVMRDPEETRNMIIQLGDLLRYALDSSRKDLVMLEEELAFSKAYLDLESHRFADRLAVAFEVAPGLERVLIPPMVLQPLVENAIKHNIARREEGGEITIRVTATAEEVQIVVEDEGRGEMLHQVGSKSGIGLSNTTSRLEKRLGPAAALQTEHLGPMGFRVSFSVPLQVA